MPDKKHFHPITILLYTISGLKNSIALVALTLIKTKFIFGWQNILFLLALFFIIFIWAILRHHFEYYQLSEERIIIYKGIFQKKETDIPYERIQTLKQKQWIFFAPFNITELLIETASGMGSEAEVNIPAVSKEVLKQIENYRYSINNLHTIDNAATNDTFYLADSKEINNFIHQISKNEIMLFSITDISIFSGFFAFIILLSQYLPISILEKTEAMLSIYRATHFIQFLGIFFLITMILLIISLGKNFFQHYNFQISRKEDTLTLQSGFFERHIQKIPVSKIQGIRVKKNSLRKLLKIVTVEIMLAGGQDKETDKNLSSKVRFLPVIHEKELYHTLNMLLPEWKITKPNIQYVSRNYFFYFVRWYLYLLLPLLLAAFLIHWAVGLAIILLFFLTIITRWLNSYYQGYSLQSSSKIDQELVMLNTITYV